MTGHGGGAHVEPILIIGSELLPVVGLHQVHPLWNLHLARPEKNLLRRIESLQELHYNKIWENLRTVNSLLEEGGKGHSELLLANILNRNGRHLL